MIPPWNSTAVLPPIGPGQSGNTLHRSPYAVEMEAVVRRFGTTPDRRRILRGLIEYRRELSRLSIEEGFQWIDGSFVEDKEAKFGTSPNDVDVVTFYHLSDGITQEMIRLKNPAIFENNHTKSRFFVDGYTQQIGEKFSQDDIRKVTYWYSMWSHTRDGNWKGFVQVKLSAEDDNLASVLLDQIEGMVGL